MSNLDISLTTTKNEDNSFKIQPVVNLSLCHPVSSDLVVVLAGWVEPLELSEGLN